MSGSRLIHLCGTDDVSEGGTLRVEAEGLTLAVYRIAGHFYVTDDHCTHGPGSLSEGILEGYEIECDFHQGRFDVRTGAVTEPPPMVPVKVYPVVVEGDRVLIEVEAAGATGTEG
ncbi:MAG TPA: Rieske 2Fe-2S domain-containing protein [Actinomycetota bacterium]|nr:Rieske 2Fe-2S domain-containing protein [Actinomycetota bacterium]